MSPLHLGRKQLIVVIGLSALSLAVLAWVLTRSYEDAIIFQHPREPIGQLVFSPDSRFLACACAHQDIVIWEMSQPNTQVTIHAHAGLIGSICFAADGQLLLSMGWDRKVCCWDVLTGARVWVIDISFRPNTMVVTPDGKTLVVSGSSEGESLLLCVPLHKAETRYLLRLNQLSDQQHSEECLCPGFEGGEVICASETVHRLCVWNVYQKKVTRRFNSEVMDSGFHNVAFSPQRKLIATSGPLVLVVLWDYDLGQEINVLGGRIGKDSSLMFSPDGAFLVGARGAAHSDTTGLLRIFTIDNKNEHFYNTGLRGGTQTVAISPDNQWIAYGGTWSDRRVIVKARSAVLPSRE